MIVRTWSGFLSVFLLSLMFTSVFRRVRDTGFPSFRGCVAHRPGEVGVWEVLWRVFLI